MKRHRRIVVKLASTYHLLAVGAAFLCLAAGKIEVGTSPDGNLVYRLLRESFLTPKAKKDLASGLSTRVVLLAKLTELPETTVAQQMLTLDSKYDLWEEKFFVTLSGAPKRAVQKQEALEKMIEAPGPFKWMPLQSLKRTAAYRIQLIQTLDPLDQEKFEAIQKWVLRQKAAANIGGKTASLEAETPFTALFYSLWKRASAGDLLTGELRREVTSEVWTVESLMRSPGITVEGL